MIREPARAVPVLAEHEVVVLGGGPAGIAAAAAAARQGADVLLVERYGFLGGMGTAGGVTNFAGLYALSHGETRQVVHGIADDLLDRIDRLGGLNAPQQGLQGRITVRSYDVSAYKCAADDLLLSCGAKLLFHALAVDAAMDGDRIAALIVETKSGRRAPSRQALHRLLRRRRSCGLRRRALRARRRARQRAVSDDDVPGRQRRCRRRSPRSASSRPSTASWTRRRAAAPTASRAPAPWCGRRRTRPSGASTSRKFATATAAPWTGPMRCS